MRWAKSTRSDQIPAKVDAPALELPEIPEPYKHEITCRFRPTLDYLARAYLDVKGDLFVDFL